MSDMKCSSCGAGFDTTVGDYCKYCGSLLVRPNNSDTPSGGDYTAEQSPEDLVKLQAACAALERAKELIEYYEGSSDREYTDYEHHTLSEFGTAGGIRACEHVISLFAEDIRGDSYSSEEATLAMSRAYNYLGWLVFYVGGVEVEEHELEEAHKKGLEALEKAVKLNPRDFKMKEHLLEAKGYANANTDEATSKTTSEATPKTTSEATPKTSLFQALWMISGVSLGIFAVNKYQPLVWYEAVLVVLAFVTVSWIVAKIFESILGKGFCRLLAWALLAFAGWMAFNTINNQPSSF